MTGLSLTLIPATPTAPASDRTVDLLADIDRGVRRNALPEPKQ